MSDSEERRGRKPRAEAAAKPFIVRLSPDERKRMERAAGMNRQSRAEFAREAIVSAASDCLED